MFQKRKRNSSFSLSKTIFSDSATTTATSSLSGSSTPSQPMPTTTASLKTLRFTPSRLKDFLLLLSFFTILYLLFHAPPPPLSTPRATTLPSPTPTSRHHLLFSIASSSSSLPRRAPYLRLWYSPNTTRAFLFLDRQTRNHSPMLPPVIVSGDTTRFPYIFKGGLKSAVRVARVVKEAVEMNRTGDVRWFVFGDDDTLFVVENLVKTLAKYDHKRWYYIGGSSESYEQNLKYSFDMAFGGGGFAVSYSLGRALARVLDSCLVRYSHLYGSDGRIFSCVAEVGVGLTHEPGFHQVDMRGNLFGLLSSHPLSPLLSLHHLDAADPLFPSMSKLQSLEHLFKAVNVDPTRILQQVVCYDHRNSLSVSIAWGYSVEVFEGNEFLPDLLAVQRSFMPWRRSASIGLSHYMFNMRDYPRDPCKRPLIFFMESVASSEKGTWSNYTRYRFADCTRANAMQNLEHIRVLSKKLEPDVEEMKAPRRQCCDIAPSFQDSMVISIRQCGLYELISMHV